MKRFEFKPEKAQERGNRRNDKTTGKPIRIRN
jgi:hypothetical protein